MPKLNSDLDYLSDLSLVVKSFEEIAATRMKNTRGVVLKSRSFAGELSLTYKIVKKSYKDVVEKYHLKLAMRKNGKTARVFISANTGLYGDMIARIFKEFSDDVGNDFSDAVIVGKMGRIMVEASGGKCVNFFEVTDKAITSPQLKSLIAFLLPYETVVVYHGLFKNVLMQDAVLSNLTGDAPGAEEDFVSKKAVIFEPGILQILDVFETEIFYELFLQVVYESQLAKFSSRMAALESASENIKRSLIIARRESILMKKRKADKDQLSMLAGRQLWEN